MVSSSILCGQNVVDEHWVTAHCKAMAAAAAACVSLGYQGFRVLKIANPK